MALVSSVIDDRSYAVVNVNTFVDVDPSLLHRSPVSFDEEDETGRLARRKRFWIARVSFGNGP